MQEDKGSALAEKRTELALQRTIIAAERTLMAWIRTSISMIGFGFTIYKFFQYLRESEEFPDVVRPHAPRNFGLTLIALGTLALIAASIQHRVFLNRLGVGAGKRIWSLAFIIAILMSLVGVMAFISIYFRTGPF